MKKHLFLFILTLAVLSVSNVWAGTIDFLTNPNSYTLYTENASLSGSSIISGQNWCVYGWDLSGEDCSSWESFTVTYDNTVPGGGIKCLYDDSSYEWAEINRYGNNPTSATISFNRSKTISKVFVQVEGSGQTLTLNSAYITFEDPIDPCAMTTIQCETYNSSLFTSSRKTENSETHNWGNPDGEMIQNNSDGKEFFYYVELPEDANYTFKVHTSTQRSQNFKIYSLTGEGSDDVGYGGQTYYQKGSSTNVNASSESWNDYYAAPNAPTISLSKGKYVIGLSCNNYARFDKIVIVADDEVFCDPACTKHAVTLAAGANGYVSGGGDYCEGASVTVTATPETSYRFVNWTYTSTGAEASTDAEYTFTLLADISLTANFEYNPCTNTKTIQCEDYDNSHVCGSTPVPSTLIINSDHTGYAHDDYPKWHGSGFADFQEHDTGGQIFFPITLPAGTYTFSVICANGGDKKIRIYNSSCSKVVDDISLSNDWGGSGWVTATTPAQTLDAGDYYISLYASNHYAAFDQMTITANSNVFCPNTITMAKSGDDGAAAPTASPANAAMAGTKVTITAGEASANHYFSGWTVSPANAVTFADQANATTTFEMPEADVMITANYGAVVSSKFTYTTSGSGSITCDTPSDSNVNSGTTISMTAVPSDDYVFTGWTATAGTFSNVATLTTTFTMPAVDATVTANFAQIDNVIITGTSATVNESNGPATLTVTSVSDFDAFNHNVLKFAYSDMEGKYKGQKVAIDEGYSPASSARATGFGFYYKTEKADDHVAFCFEVSNGHQVKWQLQATNNVWKYYYFAHPEAASWEHSGIYIYMNGDDDGAGTHTTYKDAGAFYMSEIAATSITSKPDIDTYTYTRANASNSYGTLCLPMAGSVSGATLYSVAGKQEEGGKLYIVLEEQGATLEAGEPYIFATDGSTLTATMSGAHRAANENANGLVGTYQQITAPAYSEQDNHNYVLALDNSGNTVFKKVGENVTVGAYRAYINIKNAGDYSPASAAPGRKYIRFGIEGTEKEQAVEMIYDDASLRTRKIMQNGHLYILRDGHLFTAQGTQIK